jgi:hypothetical protein
MKVLCRHCNIKDTERDEMEVEKKGNKNTYYHKQCYPKYLEEKKVREQVVCRHCNIRDTERDDMEVETTVRNSGEKINTYYHKKCFPKYLKEKEFKEKESEELDKLVETMLDIHKINKIPNQFYPFIQDLRNGTVLFGKKKKKYKEGFSYLMIAKTYEFCRESIEYWKKKKDFNDSTMMELKYCWAIINDKISFVKKREEKKAFQQAKHKAEEKEQQSTGIINHQQKVVEFKKKQRDDDISDFL